MTDTSSAFGYGALKFKKESTFATNPTPDTYVEVIKWTDNRDLVYFENDVVKQGLQQHSSGVVGHKSDSTAEMEMYLHGYSSSLPVAAPADTLNDIHPDARFVAAALGGCIAGGYDGTGVTGGTAAAPDITSTTGFVAGQAVLFDSGVNGQVGWIKTVTDANTLTLEHTLDFIPANGAKVYGSYTCFPADVFDATMSPSIAFSWLGLRADDVITYLGGRPNSLKITGAPKDFLRMSVGWSFVDWDRADSGGAPEPLTYSYPAREQILGARLLIQENTGTVTAVEVDCSKFEFDAGLGLAPKTDLNAYEGVSEWRKTATKGTLTVDPVQGIESTSAGWEYLYENQYKFTVMLQVGSTAGRTISICMPAAELTAFPVTTDREGLNAKSLTFTGMAHTRDTGTGSDSNAINKAFKVAFC